MLRLIAHGLSKAQISDTLVIAEQTTKTYVGRILAKLDLRDRAQAVVLAYETGLGAPRAFRTVHPLGWAIWKGENFAPTKEELLTGIQG